MKLQGKVAADAKVAKVAKGQYVKLAQEGTDRIFVVLAEFGNTRHVVVPGQARRPARRRATRSTFDGPLHNAIPQPDREQGQLDAVAGGLQPRLTTRTCTSTAWRSTTSRSRRAATRSTAT